MKRILTIILALVVVMLSGCAKQTQPSPPEPLSTVEVVAKVSPSVVQIVTGEGTGSGIILDIAGHVLTNNHVVEKAASANVVLSDGRTLPAQIVNRDWTMDLAVLKVTASDLRAATLGSSSQVQLGEDVLTLGFPLDLGSSVTVTKGIVSAFRQPYVQTDAPVNPGNSGGPLVNMWGEVIGVVTAKPLTQGQEPAEGIGFAIAIDEIKTRLPSLLSPQELPSLSAYTTVADVPGGTLIAVDDLDNIHCVWGQAVETYKCGVTPKLMYSVKNKGGSWSTPEILAEGRENCSGIFGSFVEPQGIAVDSEGTVHVFWRQNDVGRVGLECWDLFCASKVVGQEWSTPTYLSNGLLVSEASLALDSTDTLHLVCTETNATGFCVYPRPGIYYLYKPKEGTWSQPTLMQGTRLSETAWTGGLTLSCDSQGGLILVYSSKAEMYTAHKPAGESWAPATPVVEAKSGYGHFLPDGSWCPIEYLRRPDHNYLDMRIAADASGTTYAVSVRAPNPEDTGYRSLVLRWKTSGNGWSPEYLVYEAAEPYLSLYPVVVDSTRNLHFFIKEYQAGGEATAYRYFTVALGQVIN